MENLSEIIAAVTGLIAGVTATALVFRAQVIPVLKSLAERTDNKTDDGIVEKLDAVLAMLEEDPEDE